MLAKAGMKKINFSGGEPFLIQGGNYLGEMVRYCKEDLDIQSVTVVSNGSKVTEGWMAEYGYYLDIMAVSVDSFDQEVNEKIGRRSKSKSSHLLSLQAVRSWCREYSVLFKLNTVVNKHNYDEDMTEQIRSVHHHHHHHHYKVSCQETGPCEVESVPVFTNRGGEHGPRGSQTGGALPGD